MSKVNVTVAALGMCVLLSAGLRSDPLPESPLRYGFKAGVVSSDFIGDEASAEGDLPALSRLGFTGGAFMVIELSPKITLQPEALFVSKGAKYELTDEATTHVFRVNYLEVPVLLRVQFLPPGAVTPSIFAGPAFSVKISSTFEGRDPTSELSVDLDDVKSTDVGVVAGGALEVELQGKSLVFEVRYVYGLTDISDQPSGGSFFFDDLHNPKNGALSFLIGLGL